MESLKMSFKFKVGDKEIIKEIETTQENLKSALEGKIWRTAVVLKNSYNANAEKAEQIKKYFADNIENIDVVRLATEKGYKTSLFARAEKIILDEQPTEKTEEDFINQATEKVLEGGGQND